MPKLTASDLERVCHMLTKEYGVRVVIGGDRCTTDGKGLIVLPTLPEIENETLLSVCRFFLDHEAGHIVGKTDAGPKKQVEKSHGQAAGMILEALEDLRCERKMADLWAGCGVNIRRGSNEVLNHMAVDAKMESSRGVPAFQLMTATYAAGHDHAIPDWVDPKLAKVVEKFKPEIKVMAERAQCTGNCADLARRIFEAAQLPEDPPQEQQPGDGQKEDGEGECDNKGQGQPQAGQGQEGQGDGDENAKSDGRNGHGSADETQDGQEDEQDAGSGDDGEAEPSSGGAPPPGGAGNQDSQSDRDSDSSQDEADADSDVDGGTSDNTSGGGSGGTGADYSPGSNDLNDIGDIDIDSIADSAAKTVGDELAAMVDEHGHDAMSRPVVPELDTIERFDKEADASETCEFVANAKKSGGPMRQKLAQMLLSEAKCWYRGGLKKGSPDPRRLAGLVCGTTDRPMRRKFVRPAANTACCLLVDSSGSMGSRKRVRGRWVGERAMKYAMLAGTAFCTVLESAGHKSMMMLFDSTDTKYALTGEARRIFNLCQRQHYDEDGDVAVDDEPKNLGLRCFGVRLRIVKGWGEQAIRCYPRMAAAQGAYDGGTPMGEAILLAGKDLIRRKEKRKVMMVFTDGQPTSATTVQQAERRLAAAGIELVLIGIGCEMVKNLTDNYAIVHDVTKLGTETMEQLRKALHPGGRRR